MSTLLENNFPTPIYVCEEKKLIKNISILERVQNEANCSILLALKGFAMYSVFPHFRDVLKGTSASSLNEARLGGEEFGGEVHLYAPAYKEEEFDSLMNYSDHIIFNSFSQLSKFKQKVKCAKKKIEIGLRINPEYSEVETEKYDPCCKYSRLGIIKDDFLFDELDGVDGLHFHTHCGNNSDTLERTLGIIENKFGDVIKKMKWVNFGGGHHITRKDYDVDKLIDLIKAFKAKYDVNVYLEPGEAIALNAGVLVASVIAITKNKIDLAVLDASASAHMPDVLEMPYRPVIRESSTPDVHPFVYRLTGGTCLAGDIIGDYSFVKPLQVGQKLIFEDMLHYTMVKNNTFNGVNLPSIAIWSEKDGFRMVKKFGYEDYKSRLS